MVLPLPTASRNPDTHVQAYVLIRSMQVPPFWHGLDAHSSMSTAQSCCPPVLLQPAAHVHTYANAAIVESVVESVHVAPFWHAPEEHSLMSTEQSWFPVLLA